MSVGVARHTSKIALVHSDFTSLMYSWHAFTTILPHACSQSDYLQLHEMHQYLQKVSPTQYAVVINDLKASQQTFWRQICNICTYINIHNGSFKPVLDECCWSCSVSPITLGILWLNTCTNSKLRLCEHSRVVNLFKCEYSWRKISSTYHKIRPSSPR